MAGAGAHALVMLTRGADTLSERTMAERSIVAGETSTKRKMNNVKELQATGQALREGWLLCARILLDIVGL